MTPERSRPPARRNRRIIYLPLSALEEAELRRLVYRAYGLRGEPGYAEAIDAIEMWYVESLPDCLARLEGRRAR